MGFGERKEDIGQERREKVAREYSQCGRELGASRARANRVRLDIMWIRISVQSGQKRYMSSEHATFPSAMAYEYDDL